MRDPIDNIFNANPVPIQRQPFPRNSELPQLIDCSDWVWQKPPRRQNCSGMKPEWWIGTDADGGRWLVKMRDGTFGYREHVFTSLAQRLGISCQSSAYVLIASEKAEPRLHTLDSEPYQLALWLMDEHTNQPCSADCCCAHFFGKNMDFPAIRRASTAGIAFIEDLVRADMLGHLCGQDEPHDHFLTCNHEYVSIDHERMFVREPSLNSCHWHDCESARPVILEVCRNFVLVGDDELLEFAKLPGGYMVSGRENLYADLIHAKTVATDYLDLFEEFM